MSPRRRLLILLGLLALGLQACAGVLEFRLPKQYEHKKVKEDPPGACLPAPPAVRPC